MRAHVITRIYVRKKKKKIKNLLKSEKHGRQQGKRDIGRAT